MRHGSLFSGIGGFDLAAEWVGWTNVFHCEINPFGKKILNHYWPNSVSYEDITKTDFSIWRGKCDIISGGFPCQPFSLAGKRKGTEDDRHLWPEMLRVIREVRPKWIVGENVFGIINWDGGLVFDQVQSDLEAEGYEVQPYVLPAVSVNAPHRRDRTWFVAHAINGGYRNNGRTNRKSDGIQKINREKVCCRMPNGTDNEHPADTECEGLQESQKSEQRKSIHDAKRNDLQRISSDSCNEGLQGCKLNGTFGGEKREHGEPRGATPKRPKIQTWDNWPTQPPICSRDDEFSPKLDGITFPKWRNESIKAYGNAVVPALVYQIFKTIQLYENSEQS